MAHLGELLLDKALITRQQFRDARDRQAQLGGRLGTALLELGAINEATLLEALAAQLRVPVARAPELQGISPEIIALLPAPLAIRCEAIPFQESASQVAVAMLDVRNLGLQDELSFAAGKRLAIHIANEARIVEALEVYYGRTCSTRFRSLIERMNRSPSGTVPAQPSRPSPAAAVSSAAPAAPPAPVRSAARGPLRGRIHLPAQGPVSIPLSPEERAALVTDRGTSPAAASPAPDPVSTRPVDDALAAPEPATAVARFEHAVVDPKSPQLVGEALAAALTSLFERSILFQVSRGRISGWMGRGPGLDDERAATYGATMEERSVFREFAVTASAFRGALEQLPAHLRLLDLWHGAPGAECLVVPVRVRDRLVAVIYGDRGTRGLEGLDPHLIERLAARAAEAFERCIARRKGGAD